MSTRFLDGEARIAFKRAIETIEGTSGVEVVIAVRRRSHGYRQVNVALGTLAAFVGLAIMLYADHAFGLASILIDPFAVGLVVGGVVELLPGLKRLLVPRAQRLAHVHHGARAAFVERHVHATSGRTGLLVYISWLEQAVALVPDVALAAALPPEALARMERELTTAMPAGGARVAAALERLAPELRDAAPRSADDINELSDAIDSDLERR